MAHSEKCRILLDSLSEYIDGTLNEQFCTELEHHLESCENCRIVVDTLRKTVYLYQVNNNPPSVPPEVRERLYRTLNLEDFLG